MIWDPEYFLEQDNTGFPLTYYKKYIVAGMTSYLEKQVIVTGSLAYDTIMNSVVVSATIFFRTKSIH